MKLMAPKFVAPYRKSDKNDGNDAEAVCEAVTRPSMRFVPVKSVEQQALLAMHRVRQGFVVERTAESALVSIHWRISGVRSNPYLMMSSRIRRPFSLASALPRRRGKL